MTDSERPKGGWIHREKYSFRTGPFFETAHPGEVAFSWVSYDISRYFFEFARNFLVVGALRFAADKTGNVLLSGLFYVSLGAFVMFLYSFICAWGLKIFAHVLPTPAGEIIDGILNVLLSAVLTFGCYLVIVSVTGQMSAVQLR
jgi:hypothetical protein